MNIFCIQVMLYTRTGGVGVGGYYKYAVLYI